MLGKRSCGMVGTAEPGSFSGKWLIGVAGKQTRTTLVLCTPGESSADVLYHCLVAWSDSREAQGRPPPPRSCLACCAWLLDPSSAEQRSHAWGARHAPSVRTLITSSAAVRNFSLMARLRFSTVERRARREAAVFSV